LTRLSLRPLRLRGKELRPIRRVLLDLKSDAARGGLTQQYLPFGKPLALGVPLARLWLACAVLRLSETPAELKLKADR